VFTTNVADVVTIGTLDAGPPVTIQPEQQDTCTAHLKSCRRLAEFVGCSDPVVNLICHKTCSEPGMPARRLSNESSQAPSMMMRQMLQQSLAAQATADRRLNDASTRLATTWDPTDKAVTEACTTHVGPQFRSTCYDLYDTDSFNTEIEGMQITKECPEQKGYFTYPQAYCDLENIDLSHASMPAAVVAESCFSKCATDSTGAMCAGYDASFNADSNAICATREKCEELCDMLNMADDPDTDVDESTPGAIRCHGIDVHRSKPRCYLNGAACNANGILPDARRKSHNSWDFALRTDVRVKYGTASFLNCGGSATATSSATLSNWMTKGGQDWQMKYEAYLCPTSAGAPANAYCGTRDTCELLCSDTRDGSCFAFSYSLQKTGVNQPYCVFHDGGGCNQPTDADRTALSRADIDGATQRTSLAFKEVVNVGDQGGELYQPKCRAEVVGVPAGAPATTLGDPGSDNKFERMSASDAACQLPGTTDASTDCYVSGNADYRLQWANQEYYRNQFPSWKCEGEERVGDGWILEEKDGSGVYQPLYITFPNGACPGTGSGTDNAANPSDHSTVFTPTGAVSYVGTASDFLLELYDGMYHFRVPKKAGAELCHACNTYPYCPEGTSCFLSKTRFSAELGIQRGTCPRTSLLTGAGCWTADTCNTLPFRPKTVSTVTRAEAHFVRDQLPTNVDVFRNAPMATIVKLASIPDTIKFVVMSLASSDTPVAELGTQRAESDTQAAQQYAVPSNYDDWYTDVIRIEAMDAQCSASTSEVCIHIYAPAAPHLVIFRFAAGQPAARVAAAARSEMTEGASHAGYFFVCLPPGDYAGTTEAQCPTPGASLIPTTSGVSLAPFTAAARQSGGLVSVICDEPTYLPQLSYHCTEGSYKLSTAEVASVCGMPRDPCSDALKAKLATAQAASQMFMDVDDDTKSVVCLSQRDTATERAYFRLTHRSRLDYGWRIKAIQLFKDEACTDNSGNKVAYSFVTGGDAGAHATSQYYSVTDADGNPKVLFGGADDAGIKRRIKDVTPQAAGKATDANTDGFNDGWWSSCLNCNPYRVDETHGITMIDSDSAHVDFEVDSATDDVRCVKVWAKARENKKNMWDDTIAAGDYDTGALKQYYPIDIVLYRGWRRGDRRNSLSEIQADGFTHWFPLSFKKETRDDDTFRYDLQDEAPDKTFAVASFDTTCGRKNTHIFGELLWHEENIPGPCHCQQLCLDWAERGCVSWKWRVPTAAGASDCFLQSQMGQSDLGDCEADDGWISGDMGVRLKPLSMTVTASQAFNLTLEGYNFPVSDSGDYPQRQRIKLVEESSAEGASDNVRGNLCSSAAHPKAVQGVQCVKGFICSPAPSRSTEMSATWSGLKIRMTAAETRYRVCYNAGTVYNPFSWHLVPGHITVVASPYSWTVQNADHAEAHQLPTPTDVVLNDEGEDLYQGCIPELDDLGDDVVTEVTSTFKIRVARPPFATYTDNSNWELKLIPAAEAYDGCNSLTEEADQPTTSAVDGVDAKTFDKKCSPINEDRHGAGGVGYFPVEPIRASREGICQGSFVVCFRDTTTGLWQPIPPKTSSDGPFLKVHPVESVRKERRHVFQQQMWSGRAGSTVRLTVKGSYLGPGVTGKITLLLPSLYDSEAGAWRHGCGSAFDGNAVDNVACTADSDCPASAPTCHSGFCQPFVGIPVSSTWGPISKSYGRTTTESFDFDVPLTGMSAGRYGVCFCDEQIKPRAVAGGGESWWISEFTRPVAGAATQWGPETIPGSYDKYKCSECASGCTGPDCFCDDYNAGHGLTGEFYCASPSICREIAEAADAELYIMHRTANVCKFLQTRAARRLADSNGGINIQTYFSQCYDTFVRRNKATCEEIQDHTMHVGDMWVTERPHVNVDWVLTPLASQTVEVLGDSLSYLGDRIAIIGGNGTCGLSDAATDALVEPYDHAETLFDVWYSNYTTGASRGTGRASQWGQVSSTSDREAMTKKHQDTLVFFNTWQAANQHLDRPSDNDVPSGDIAPTVQAPVSYEVHENKFCVGSNIAIVGANPVTVLRADEHQCAGKCAIRGPCHGPDCFCDGHFLGYDHADSAALCLSMARCQEICAAMGDDCYGIDMHKTLPRCFLNTRTTCSASDGLRDDPNYNFVYKTTAVTRRAQATPPHAMSGGAWPQPNDAPDVVSHSMPQQGWVSESYLAADLGVAEESALEMDTGYSCESILRFRHVKFRSGGLFKVCFCDHTLLTGRFMPCKEKGDYMIEIGHIHSSGVSCLVEDARFRRGVCVAQWGVSQGLRCYSGAAPPQPECGMMAPRPVVTTVEPTAPEQQVVSSWCLYGPEEQTSSVAMCATVRRLAR